ncbi:hypothetical protein [Pseudomonas sp. HMWF021]|uniref:hypothetical protein n=1 Tax=Pseudomonas sp. HMWF021 TaxID=2056857 RepID=UPI0011B23F98|nr:hypothetical protein [Pseudomonas sp. HMWF021]
MKYEFGFFSVSMVTRRLEVLREISIEVGGLWIDKAVDPRGYSSLAEEGDFSFCWGPSNFLRMSANALEGRGGDDFVEEVKRLYLKVLRFNGEAEIYKYLDGFLVGSKVEVKDSIKFYIVRSRSIICPLQRAAYIYILLNERLKDIPLGWVLASLYSALILIQGGEFPATLFCGKFQSQLVQSVSDKYCPSFYDYFSLYVQAAIVVLGCNPKVINEIESSLLRRTMHVFGNRELADRWLSKPSIKYGGLPPRVAVISGYELEVFENLVKIESGFWG